MIRVAILGAGSMGSTHARAFRAIPGVTVSTIYAPSDRRAGPLATEIGASWTDDLDRAVADPDIDAVSVCLPAPDHRRAAEAALAAGKHVLVEKPITLTDEDASALVEMAAQSDEILMVAHVLRFWAGYVEVAQMVADGRIGAPRSALATRRQASPAWSDLFTLADLTGGAVIDMLVHDVDALNWLFGEPVRIAAQGRINPASGGYDQVQIMIDYGDGRSALVDGGMTMPGSYPFSATLEVLGEYGAAEYRFRAGGRGVEAVGGIDELHYFPDSGDQERISLSDVNPYDAEITYFISCIRAGQPASRATPVDARLALRTALAAKRSLESGGTLIELSSNP